MILTLCHTIYAPCEGLELEIPKEIRMHYAIPSQIISLQADSCHGKIAVFIDVWLLYFFIQTWCTYFLTQMYMATPRCLFVNLMCYYGHFFGPFVQCVQLLGTVYD